MTPKTKILLFLLLLAHTLTGLAQTSRQTYKEAYDLNFTMAYTPDIVYPWLENAAYATSAESVFLEEPHRTFFAKAYYTDSPLSDRLQTELEQRIVLPSAKGKEAVIHLETKGYNIRQATMTIQALNAQEQVLRTEVCTFSVDTTLTRAFKGIDISRAEMLNIQINAVGKSLQEAFLAFSAMDIIIDGQSIRQLPIRSPSPIRLNRANTHTPINLQTARPWSRLQALKNKKIIGLGESIHGNTSLQNMAYDYILHAAEKQNARLILLEMPFERALAYNRYIQDERYLLDSSFVQAYPSVNFLNRLRSFNRNRPAKNKVKIYGMDYNYMLTKQQNTAMDIFDFIATINPKAENQYLNQLLLLLTQEDKWLATQFIQTHRQQLTPVLSMEEQASIAHILQLSANMGASLVKRFQQRDSVMYANAHFLIDNYANEPDAQVVVYGHGVHINTSSTYPAVATTPLGGYMHQTYGESYHPLTLLVGEGSTTAYNEEMQQVEAPLAASPAGSIEDALKQIPAPAFYLPFTPDFNRLALTRFKGSSHIHQEFYPFNLYQRFKGAFFIRRSAKENTDKQAVNTTQPSQQFAKKLKQRQEILRLMREKK